MSVLHLPGGIAGVIVDNTNLMRKVFQLSRLGSLEGRLVLHRFYGLWLHYLLLLLSLIPLVMSLSLIIEMLYQLQLTDDISFDMVFAGLQINPTDPYVWLLGATGGVISYAVFHLIKRSTSTCSSELSELIKDNLRQTASSTEQTTLGVNL